MAPRTPGPGSPSWGTPLLVQALYIVKNGENNYIKVGQIVWTDAFSFMYF